MKKEEPRRDPYSQPLKGLVQYTVEDYDRLNYLEDAPDTKRLIKALSESIVRCGIRVYRIMRDIQKKVRPLTEEDLEKPASELDLEPDQLFRLLTADPDPVTAQRIEHGQHTPDRGPGRPPDFPKIILSVYLHSHLRTATGKAKYSLIDGFLLEQNIGDAREESSVSRQVRRYPSEDLEAVYRAFRQVYIAPHVYGPSTLESILDSVQEMRRATRDKPEGERDLLFPAWEDYLPS
ncbi:MAG: hypothetical protein SWE60_01905 [Thermodesulfobacteriota bacterium]|nr:hypothetical protein [Thermodesulfobacteriota bacterium]